MPARWSWIRDFGSEVPREHTEVAIGHLYEISTSFRSRKAKVHTVDLYRSTHHRVMYRLEWYDIRHRLLNVFEHGQWSNKRKRKQSFVEPTRYRLSSIHWREKRLSSSHNDHRSIIKAEDGKNRSRFSVAAFWPIRQVRICVAIRKDIFSVSH